ncbi:MULTISPECIES: DUF3800 domain-containing protein [Nostocales]|jgi:hypothetical protein|uniref:DUF3800 domain-containing protein n=1 Tax=Dolichospermum flos-aquae UHCC 0037 TaxID=2590026 RepID=A0ACC7S5Z2_DOLFA|nr:MULTISPECIES: DUF3800 domain-containing protein [Nostocales]MBO1067675.1 DUF3800 domain-containing protein [Anabaena sp. 54]MCX5983978.1 DUF3800 domain-containing protein [Nostocales cyanobacterium LacPavin_0920_SED1_MAG_38_18]MTJ42902.1 DUF3800 domain-containing protein [Dolichospermum flos-aquae UHCC 0037]
MYLLYADESGTTHDLNQQYFVLAGFCIFERQGYWISDQLDKIAARFDPADPLSVELHGSPMLSGRGKWRSYSKSDREKAIEDILQVFLQSHPSNRLFASVIKKTLVSPKDPVEVAFEQLASRFDRYLIRLHKHDNTQRGIIIFDKSTYETTIQSLATDFRTIGYSWGVIRNFSEVPLFLDSKASRLIQLADIIAYAIFRNFEKGDSRFFSIIQQRFDSEGGIVHGLHILQ